MSKQYDEELKGVLFANKDKKSDAHPNAKGSAQVDGVEYWVSCWVNTDKNGNRYQRLQFQRKDEVHRQGMEQAREALESFEDPLPF